MAVIPAVDYQPPDLSHFHSRAFWQAGKLDPSPSTGWLGRWVDQNGGAANPLQAISVDWTLDGSLKSATNPVAVLSSTEDAQFGMRNVWTDQSAMVGTLESLTQRPAANPAMAAADDALGGAVSIANRLSGLGSSPDLAAPYGDTDFERRMSMLAWLISANVGIRVACLSFDDGFDFHDAQLSRQGGIMTRLSRGLAAFLDRQLRVVAATADRQTEGQLEDVLPLARLALAVVGDLILRIGVDDLQRLAEPQRRVDQVAERAAGLEHRTKARVLQ